MSCCFFYLFGSCRLTQSIQNSGSLWVNWEATMTGKKQKKSYSSMTSDRNSWNCLSSEGAICEQGLALRHCGTCKLRYLEAHFRKKRGKKWNNVYYLTHHEEKPLPSLPAKCPDVTTHGVQSYVMWKINLWQTMLSCTRGYHLKFSSIFCKVLLPHHQNQWDWEHWAARWPRSK